MEHVGAYEAKTHLAQLLDRVARGESIVITRHGVPVAVLQPPDGTKKRPVREIVDEMRELAKGNELGDEITIRELIEEGRRF